MFFTHLVLSNNLVGNEISMRREQGVLRICAGIKEWIVLENLKLTTNYNVSFAYWYIDYPQQISYHLVF
jgi:hypothetical protein